MKLSAELPPEQNAFIGRIPQLRDLLDCIDHNKIKKWNDSRNKRNDRKRLDLRGTNLSHKNIKNLNLSSSNFSGSYFSSDFRNIKFDFSIFVKANIQCCCFNYCSFINCNFNSSIFKGTEFNNCLIHKCSFSNTKFYNTTFKGCTFKYIDYKKELAGAEIINPIDINTGSIDGIVLTNIKKSSQKKIMKVKKKFNFDIKEYFKNLNQFVFGISINNILKMTINADNARISSVENRYHARDTINTEKVICKTYHKKEYLEYYDEKKSFHASILDSLFHWYSDDPSESEKREVKWKPIEFNSNKINFTKENYLSSTLYLQFVFFYCTNLLKNTCKEKPRIIYDIPIFNRYHFLSGEFRKPGFYDTKINKIFKTDLKIKRIIEYKKKMEIKKEIIFFIPKDSFCEDFKNEKEINIIGVNYFGEILRIMGFKRR